MTETEVQERIQIEGPRHGCILMRNNSGALEDKTGRIVRYGLGNVSKAHNEKLKSSDLIGIKTILITPDMVGKKIGVFTAVEVKRDDWNKNKKLDKREQAQKNFIDWVTSHGGLAGFANCTDDLRNILCGYQAK